MAYRKKRGVPKGYIHNWTYRGHWKEKKIKPGLWKGTFKATKKTRSGRGGPKPGFKVKWKLWGTQTAKKTARGTYQTLYNFKKKLLKTNRRKRY